MLNPIIKSETKQNTLLQWNNKKEKEIYIKISVLTKDIFGVII
jgi:hypothetical protein